MLSAVLMIPILFVAYYVLWKLYLKFSPDMVSSTAPGWVKNPDFWQFAGAMFVLTLLIAYVNKKD